MTSFSKRLLYQHDDIKPTPSAYAVPVIHSFLPINLLLPIQPKLLPPDTIKLIQTTPPLRLRPPLNHKRKLHRITKPKRLRHSTQMPLHNSLRRMVLPLHFPISLTLTHIVIWMPSLYRKTVLGFGKDMLIAHTRVILSFLRATRERGFDFRGADYFAVFMRIFYACICEDGLYRVAFLFACRDLAAFRFCAGDFFGFVDDEGGELRHGAVFVVVVSSTAA